MNSIPVVEDLHGRPSAQPLGLVRSAFEQALGRPAGAAAQSFLRQFASGSALGEMSDGTAEVLAAQWARLWSRAQEAQPLPQVILGRLEPTPQVRTLLEIVDAERPFQLDSIVDELSQQRLAPLAIFQAVVSSKQAAPSGAGARIRVVQILLPAISDERAGRLVEGLEATLADVRAAVEDYGPMRALLSDTMERLKRAGAADPRRHSEEIAFLEWLVEDHFVLLGTRVYRYPRDGSGGLAADEPMFEAGDGLGILRDAERRILRRGHEPSVLTPQLKLQAERPDRLIVAKSNFRSRVHRRVHADYVGVVLHDGDGRPEGEVRFLGLFTAEAYDRPAGEVPLIGPKVRRLVERLSAGPGRPAKRRLRNILENYPRDELFQAGEQELSTTILGIAELRDRPRVRLFVRTDPFDRFVSALLFVPRDRYHSAYGERAGGLLASAYGGRVSALYPTYGDSPLARVHYIIGIEPGDHPRPDLAQLEAQLAEASLDWSDRLRDTVETSDGVLGDRDRVLERWRDAFGAGYRERYGAGEALSDIVVVEETAREAGLAVRAFRHREDPPRCFRFKIYHSGATVPLAEVIPILQDMGLKALGEDGFVVRPAGGDEEYWIHEFVVDDPRGAELSFGDVAKPFEDAFLAVWTGLAESDGFNRLVLELGTGWREAALVRALARFRQQTGLDPSEAVQQTALAEHAPITRLLLDLFRTRLDPAAGLTLEARAAEGERLRAKIEELLDAVPGIDADRALRRLLALILAIKRTNFYQVGADGGPKPHIAIKIASEELDDLPAPKPYREIFVSAPNVEGSHLRFGPVARGGLRWSDRRDDFRSEVLGLVKAQQVKNAVIVPVGSKGGFYAKHAPAAADPGRRREAGIEAYRAFLSGMLDVTDNIDSAGKTVRPPDVVAHDEDDPYLVVAADKGTAAFSDIANEVSASYGFWLGDAFASGGSAGYDHKAMGITARGAWEAVKRHFRERGKDVQSEPFTAVGVGDMSGDVFGNGMLLSKQTRLVAAFDHRDIFIDPDPDPAVSWEERRRLFELPRSSWQDYDRSKISAGGGVFPRTAKSIPLSGAMRAALGTELESATPAELIRAILKAPVELLYMGGIGTYVKGSGETNADAADKANDAIRIDGAQLRAAVVGEGANLGFTQAGRIEYARSGGRINTDAIDNSGGVDSSDLEVNIKILTAALESRDELDRESRDALLSSMTDEVAALVLRHNRDQTLALSLIEADAASDLDSHAALIAEFEQQGRLDRAVEGLPDSEALAELREAGQGLTRPELAVLMAYSKLALFDSLVASAAPDDPWFESELKNYFPRALRRFERAMGEHRLRREIVATIIANDMVNLVGPAFPWRLMAGGCDARVLATAFAAAREIFRIGDCWGSVQALGTEASAEVQLKLHRALAHALRRQTAMLARRQSMEPVPVAHMVEAYGPGADALRDNMTAAEAGAGAVGVPPELSASIDGLARLHDAVTAIELASAAGSSVPETAEFFRRLRASLGLGRLYAAAGGMKPPDRYGRLAAERVVGEIERTEERIAARALRACAAEGGLERGFERWAAAHAPALAAARDAIVRIDDSDGPWTLGKLIAAQGAVLDLDGALSARANEDEPT